MEHTNDASRHLVVRARHGRYVLSSPSGIDDLPDVADGPQADPGTVVVTPGAIVVNTLGGLAGDEHVRLSAIYLHEPMGRAEIEAKSQVTPTIVEFPLLAPASMLVSDPDRETEEPVTPVGGDFACVLTMRLQPRPPRGEPHELHYLYVAPRVAGWETYGWWWTSPPDQPTPAATGPVLLDEVVHTDYGQFDIVYSDSSGFDGDADRFFAGQTNGWVGAASPDGVYVVLGRRSGGSRVRIVLVDAEPAIDPSWEDVVEVSTTVPPGSSPAWLSWAGESGGQLALPAGEHRMRVSARGRDAGAADELVDDVVDEYLVELWPASASPDAILRSTSDDASYWNDTWGGHR